MCQSSCNSPNASRLNTSKKKEGVPLRRDFVSRTGDVTSCGSRRWNFLRARVHGSARSLGKYDGGLNSCASASSKVYSVSLSPKAICIGDIIPSTHPHFVHSLSPTLAHPRNYLLRLSAARPDGSFSRPPHGHLSHTPSTHLGTSRDLWNWISSGSPESKTWTILNLN